MNLKDKGKESRKKLLEAAEACFTKYGFHASSVDMICKAAGMSKGAFYHHFTSKQELYLEMLDQWLKIIDRYIESARSDSKNVLELFRNIGEAKLLFQEAAGKLPIFIELWVRASRDEELKKITIGSYYKYLELFKSLIDEGINEGLIKKVNPDTVSRMVIAVAVGFIMQGMLDPEGTDWDRVARECPEIILKGLARL
ncbi:MAG: TetR/AcrR family transcriptional regulator [Candidatus Humimicrobiaceae bacterium]|jgi:AcrR family transcriptional regulator|nr:TetR/AcrR family transcriptional regulator [Actinomycetota bacterium]MDY0027579.1 TetR/AcrR family transcriptional regulator [Candidatus Humimicrobiaceae bacterium]